MSFVFPGFLFAFFAISIPIIIHLFRFRRFRTVYFPNIAFLQQLSEASDKESRLKHLLILLARILSIAFLVLAFSRPYIPSGEEDISSESNAIGVYIDNSFSMNASSIQGRLLDEAKNRAAEIAGMYLPTDRFMLLTNDFEGRHQRFVSREEFYDLVSQVEESASVRTISEVMTRKSELFATEQAQHSRAYYISDFQKSTSGLEDISSEPDPTAYLIPLQAQHVDNVFIDSCWFESPVRLPGEPVTMNVRIKNKGLQNLENQPLRLHIDGQQRSVVVYNVAAGGQTDVELTWSASIGNSQNGFVEIIDYPVTFDDRMFFTYTVSTEIPVLSLDGQGNNPYLQALFGSNDLFKLRSMPGFSIDFSVFSRYPLIVMNGFTNISAGLAMELQRYVEEGGSLAVFPGSNIDIPSYNALLQTLGLDTYARLDTVSMPVTSLNELHPLFDGVFEHLPENIDLPVAKKHYAITRQVRSLGQDLLQLQNGLPFFSSYRSGNGNVYLSAVPLDNAYSNFQRHSLFVPVMANVALHSGSMQPLYHTLGKDMVVNVTGGAGQSDLIYTIKKDGFEVIPEQRRRGNRMQLLFHDQISEAGNYFLYLGDEQIDGLSFNYDRRESVLEAYDKEALENLLADNQIEEVRIISPGQRDLGQVMHEMGMGQQLWRMMLLLALLFILIEVLILRFWK